MNLSELHLAQPSNGEEALEICDVLVRPCAPPSLLRAPPPLRVTSLTACSCYVVQVRSGGVDVLVVDSVAALVPRAELEGEMGDHHIALQARLMSQVGVGGPS